GVLDGDPCEPRQLCGLGDHLAPVARLIKEAFGVGFLEEAGPYLGGWDVRRKHQNGCARAVRVEDALNQMSVAWAAARCADGELAVYLRLCRGRECCGFFIADVNPVDPALGRAATAAHGVGEGIQAVAHEAKDVSDARLHQQFDKLVGSAFRGKRLTEHRPPPRTRVLLVRSYPNEGERHPRAATPVRKKCVHDWASVWYCSGPSPSPAPSSLAPR